MSDQYEARISASMGNTGIPDDELNDSDFLFNNSSSTRNNNNNSTFQTLNNNNNNNNNNNYDFLLDEEYNDDEDDEEMLALYNLSPRQRFFYKIKHILITNNLKRFKKLPAWQKVSVLIAGCLTLSLFLTMLVLHKRILNYVVTTSNELQQKWYTPWLLFFLIFLVSFPPLIGYSLLSTSVGMIYGVSAFGWFLLASSTVLGATASFYVFQKFLNSYAEKLVHSNRKFEAITSVLQENNSYLILALVRLCPFPYSLTNGALAGIYGISLKNFFIANIIVSPKLFIYLFIGSRLKRLGESGESSSNKLFDVLSIVFAFGVLSITAAILYAKTKKRYRELQENISI